VKLLVEFFQSAAGDLGVDLGGGQIGMAQHRLDRSQVGAALQKVRGKGMSQHVRGNRAVDPGQPHIFFQQLPAAHGAISGARGGRAHEGSKDCAGINA